MSLIVKVEEVPQRDNMKNISLTSQAFCVQIRGFFFNDESQQYMTSIYVFKYDNLNITYNDALSD